MSTADVCQWATQKERKHLRQTLVVVVVVVCIDHMCGRPQKTTPLVTDTGASTPDKLNEAATMKGSATGLVRESTMECKIWLTEMEPCVIVDVTETKSQ